MGLGQTVPAYYSAESQRGSTERLVSLEKEKALNAQRDLEALQRSIGELSLKITSEGQVRRGGLPAVAWQRWVGKLYSVMIPFSRMLR